MAENQREGVMVDQAENYLLVWKSLHHIRVYKTEILLTIC